MIRHSAECRARGYKFAADPSQQLAFMPGSDVLSLISGAEFLLTNDYERSLLETKAGLTADEVLEHVKLRITTLGKDGVEITGKGIERIHVPVARDVIPDDPTGVGDGFRAGFFAALSWGLGLERAAQVGSLIAALVLETVGPQEYDVVGDQFAKRFADSYGEAAAAEIKPFLPA
jgi:adenosine kinase